MEVRSLAKVITSKEEILNTCREMVADKGMSSISMRSVAASCHVALGSLYNYFPSKEALLTETIASVWQDIFHMGQCQHTNMTFPESVADIYAELLSGTRAYPNFFTAHSLSFTSSEKNEARITMNQYMNHILSGLKQDLEHDPACRPDTFNAQFTKEDFLQFILSSLISSLISRKQNCSTLTEMIRRTIY